MEFSDRTLTCVECKEEFIFSAGEQMFFKEKNFENEPKRCKKCAAKRANVRTRREALVICAACGSLTVVPFVPSQERPVLCRSCFTSARARWIADTTTARATGSKQVKPTED